MSLSNQTLSTIYGKRFEDSFGSGLTKNCVDIYNNKLIKDYEPDDLRVMIQQKIGVEHLIVYAMEYLRENLMVEATYPGGLLNAVVESTVINSVEYSGYKQELKHIIDNTVDELNEYRLKLDKFTGQ